LSTNKSLLDHIRERMLSFGDQYTHFVKVICEIRINKPIQVSKKQGNLKSNFSKMIDQSKGEEIIKLWELFHLFDKDGDGVITRIELGLAIRSLDHNPTETEFVDIVNECDGAIDYPQFLSVMARTERETDLTKEKKK